MADDGDFSDWRQGQQSVTTEVIQVLCDGLDASVVEPLAHLADFVKPVLVHP